MKRTRALHYCLLFFLVGCQQGNLYRDLREARASAHHEWLLRREGKDRTTVLLDGELALADAIKLALIHNQTLRAVVEERAVARGDLVASYAGFLPQLNGFFSYQQNRARNLFPGAIHEYSAGLDISQPLFRGGASVARRRAAQLATVLADEIVRDSVQQTIFEVAAQYYQVLLGQFLVEANQQAVVSSSEQLDNARRKLEQGLVSDYDVLRAQVDLSNFEAEMIAQQNRRDLARARMLKAMGVSQKSQVDLTDTLEFFAMKPIFERAMEIAHKNRADLFQVEANVRIQEQALAIARSRYFPQADAVFQHQWTRPHARSGSVDEFGGNTVGGVQVSWPLLDGLAREGNVIREKALLRQRYVDLLEAEQRVELEVQEAILNLRNAEEFVGSQELNLDRAEEALRIVTARYREGASKLVEVTDARSAVTQARSLYYQAIHDHTLARLQLQLALGILGPVAGDRSVAVETPVEPASIDEFETGEETLPEPSSDDPSPLPSTQNESKT